MLTKFVDTCRLWLKSEKVTDTSHEGISTFVDVHESVHRDLITKTTKKLQLCRLIYYSLSAVHVSGDVFTHHQEHFTVFAASGNIHNCRFRLVS
jgi:hypothetical protein